MDRATHTKRTKRIEKPAAIAAVLILLIPMIASCDQIDASQILSKAGLGETLDDKTSADLAMIDPDMESVGPEGATRIYYQFVDSSGRVQFVERITDVPAFRFSISRARYSGAIARAVITRRSVRFAVRAASRRPSP
jgi:hypothetical protein